MSNEIAFRVGSFDAFSASFDGGEFTFELDEPWAGSTDTGFGQHSYMSLSKDQAKELADFIYSKLATPSPEVKAIDGMALGRAAWELQRHFGREGSIYGIEACEEIARLAVATYLREPQNDEASK